MERHFRSLKHKKKRRNSPIAAHFIFNNVGFNDVLNIVLFFGFVK